MPIVGRFGSLAGLGSLILPGGAMESIATVSVGSGGASSIAFSDIPGGFQHLQVRGALRHNTADRGSTIRFNSDSGNNYAWHRVFGDGASATASATTSTSNIFAHVGAASTADAVGGFVLDILDYGNTSKNKTTRSLTGTDANGNGYVMLTSGLWMSTSAVTSITFTVDGNYEQFSTVALYGVRA